MRRSRIIALAALGTVLLGAPAALQAGGGPGNLLVVVNDESPDSLDVANHYRLRRDIPERCFCHLRLKPVHDISRADFERQILGPVLDHIEREGLRGHTRFIVFTCGLPYRVNWTASAKTSVCTVAATGSTSIGHMKKQPYYTSRKPFRSLPGMPYLSICLTGYSAADVIRCIDQGVASDGTRPKGTIYLFDGIGPRARVHPAYGRPEGIEEIQKHGVRYEVRSGHSLKDEKDVLGYWTGAVRVNTKNIRFLPGALADHLTSFGGILFNNKSQMSILDFIRAGASGSYGTVMEPTNIPTRHSKGWVFGRYLSGLSLIEAYWSSVEDVQLGVFVGEALATPFAHRPEVKIEGAHPKKPAKGVAKLKVTARPKKDGIRLRDLTWWVDGRPFGPAYAPESLVGTDVKLEVDGQTLSAVFAKDGGIRRLARELAEAVNRDGELGKPDGIRAEVQGSRLVLRARREGPGANGRKWKARVTGGGEGCDIKVDPDTGKLSGGAETQKNPAFLEISFNAKKPLAGDSVTIASGGETYKAVMDEKDLASTSPVISFVRKLLGPMKESKVFGQPKARALGGQRAKRVILQLVSPKEAEEGNGQKVKITVSRGKGSKFYISPAGDRVLENGATRTFYAAAEIDLFAVFDPLASREVELDTRKLGDGYHTLFLSAEEDSPVRTKGWATAALKVQNKGGKLRLSVPKGATFRSPVKLSARFYGTFPGGPKRMVLLVDGREAGTFDRSKKIVFDPTKFPLGEGSHSFQVHVEPRKQDMPTVTSDPVMVNFQRGK
jgi:uncharacterized protein (TIGR03790 family)